MSNVNGIGNSQPFASIEQSISPTAGRLARTDAGKPAIGQAASQSGGGEMTNLSVTAGLLANALSTSDVRMGLVARLQESIAAGTYNVSASDVASKMMSSLFN